MVSLFQKEVHMDVTVRYMLRPVARCKEGCARVSWA
jgi:hypothetical protein